jgi:pimeloyl-ACP methyl ester carboxylesterase
MPRALSNGIELEYDTFGDPSDPALLLVMGFTAQMTAWDEELCKLLVDEGLYVIRFDNRDCGLSTKLDGVQVDLGPFLVALMAHEAPPADATVPYKLTDMAADAIGLLDHLGIERAHIAGASMGGMIVQTMAIEHPERLESVVSVMSMPGDVAVGRPDPAALEVLLSPPPTEREAYIENSVRTLVWASKRYGDADRIRRNAARDFDRAFYPEGATRQLAAIYASGDRSEALRSVTVPMLVIPGRDDTLISPSGGERTAELVPGANLLMLADMGHDLPEQLWPLIVDAVTMHTAHAARMRELV